MRKLAWIKYALFILLYNVSNAQEIRPAVAIQSGFSNVIKAHFRFSHLNNYLYGFNDFGEFVLWEMRSGKQVKKLTPLVTEFPTLYYVPQSSFSNDEKFILIPDYPKGNYFLYDVEADRIAYTYKPPFSQERFTHAFFSEDGTRVMLFAQAGGDNPYCRLQIKDLQGNLAKSMILNVSKPVVTDKLLIRLLLGRLLKALELYPVVYSIVPSPNLDKIWFAPGQGNLFTLDLSRAPENRELREQDYSKIILAPHQVIIQDLSINGDRLMAREESSFKKLKNSNVYLMTDSIYTINKNNNRKEKITVSNFFVMPEDKRANSIPTSPITTGQSMSTYFVSQDLSSDHFKVTCRDVLTDKELFTYNMGDPVLFISRETLKAGQFNGGYVVAISDDQSLVAECTGDLVVHDIKKKSIKTNFPLMKGNFKLNSPVFLDTNRIFIPKVYNDGFVLDLRSAKVDRLKREVNCQDTVRNGANVYFPVDNGGVIGLQNSCLSADKKTMAIVNYIPNDACNAGRNKTIEVYDAAQLKKIEQFEFSDKEFSYHLNMVPGNGRKFLVSYKLFDFSDKEKYTVRDLKIIQKRDTFLAVNPVYLPSTNSIFSILGTRSKPGNPDLIFAQWDLEGKLIKSFKFERSKSKQEFQTVIYESQLSPDGNQLMFGLADGTTGIFNIPAMSMTALYEHGKSLEVKILKIHDHNMVMAGCFIDNDNFVTNGNDGQVNLWSISQKKLVRVVNKIPVILCSLSLSPDKKYLVGTDMDKSILFINVATGEVDLRFMAFDNESYAMIDKDGYYMANKRSNNNLTFFYKSKSYEFSQFDLYLNRPDKIIEQVGRANAAEVGFYKTAYEKRLNKLGYKQATLPPIAPDEIPEIRIGNLPENLRETADEKLSVLLSASDRNYPIRKVFVTVNGIPIYGVKGMELKDSRSKAVSVPLNIPLAFGKNRIEISAMNGNGVESLMEYITITRTGKAVRPDLFIISVGSAQFAQSANNLKYPAKDAKDLVNLFQDQSAHFGQINSFILQNEKVTKANFSKLKEQLRKTKPDDYVILFYAGHGVLDKNLDYYLSTYNTDFTNPASQSLTYLDMEWLLDSIPARNKVMFLDACHSGELDKESVQKSTQKKTTSGPVAFRAGGDQSINMGVEKRDDAFKLMQSLFSDLRRTSGASVIAAAGAAEYAVESDRWQNGVFTYCLQTGLREKKADLNKDGKVYLSELLEFLQTEVSGLTGRNQEPTSRAENLVNDLLIWY